VETAADTREGGRREQIVLLTSKLNWVVIVHPQGRLLQPN